MAPGSNFTGDYTEIIGGNTCLFDYLEERVFRGPTCLTYNGKISLGYVGNLLK